LLFRLNWLKTTRQPNLSCAINIPTEQLKHTDKAWVREQFDRKMRREDRLETVEVAILVFVIVGVVADLLIVGHELKWF
jgi:hypothetical protein